MAAAPPPSAALRRRRLLRGADAAGGTTLDGAAQAVLCDNDYLGLARDPRLAEAMHAAARRHGAGAAASPLVTGYTDAHRDLEEALAEFTGRERALAFASGYLANLGAVQALAGRGDVLVEDRRNHASLIDAARASRARCRRYRHADAGHAAELMRAHGARLVLTDGVFSMDGDEAPVAELARTAAGAGALLLVDDAHGLGVLGANGGGLLEEAGLTAAEAPLLIGTLGKAFGAQGGFAAGPADLIEELLQRARTYTYCTALAPPLAAAAAAGVRLAREEPERRARLRRNIDHFRRGAAERGVALPPSRSAIQPLVLGAPEAALAASEALARQGLAVRAIRPPTVPAGASRLRVALSARHRRAELERLLDALAALPPARIAP